MALKLKRIWHDPVGSNAIGGIIAAILLALAGWVAHRQNWWPTIWHELAMAWAFLFSTTPVRHWLLGLLLLMAVLFVVLLVAVIVIALQAKNQNPEDWRSYTSDSFYGVKWLWTYEGREIRMRAVLCSRCDYQVGPDDASNYANSFRFHCDSCGSTVPVEGQSWDSLNSVVMRLVHQKLRTGTYPKPSNPSAA